MVVQLNRTISSSLSLKSLHFEGLQAHLSALQETISENITLIESQELLLKNQEKQIGRYSSATIMVKDTYQTHYFFTSIFLKQVF